MDAIPSVAISMQQVFLPGFSTSALRPLVTHRQIYLKFCLTGHFRCEEVSRRPTSSVNLDADDDALLMDMKARTMSDPDSIAPRP